MADDQTQGQNGAAAASEPEPPDIADDEELDVVIERVAPQRRRGLTGGAWVAIVLLAAVAAIAAGVFMKHQADETARKARESRALTYKTQEAGIAGTIDEAASLAEKGEVDAALKLLDAAAEKWAQLAGAANGSKDIDEAKHFANQQARLKAAIDGLTKDRDEVAKLDQQIADLTAKRTALTQGVRDKIRAISGQPAAPPAEAAPATAPEAQPPAVEETPAEPAAEEAPALETPEEAPVDQPAQEQAPADAGAPQPTMPAPQGG